jgi:hypothetical protein
MLPFDQLIRRMQLYFAVPAPKIRCMNRVIPGLRIQARPCRRACGSQRSGIGVAAPTPGRHIGLIEGFEVSCCDAARPPVVLRALDNRPARTPVDAAPAPSPTRTRNTRPP